MIDPKEFTLSNHFTDIEEPRSHNIRHKLIDIMTVSICAVVCRPETRTQVEEYVRSKHEWFSKFLELYGIGLLIFHLVYADEIWNALNPFLLY